MVWGVSVERHQCFFFCSQGYTPRHFSEILSNQAEIRLYSSFFDSFGTNAFAILNQSKNGKYNLISVWFTKISLGFGIDCKLKCDMRLEKSVSYATTSNSHCRLGLNWFISTTIQTRSAHYSCQIAAEMFQFMANAVDSLKLPFWGQNISQFIDMTMHLHNYLISTK